MPGMQRSSTPEQPTDSHLDHRVDANPDETFAQSSDESLAQLPRQRFDLALDQPGSTAATRGPLEAVKGYLERQRRAAALPQSSGIEANEARPPWLRRWPRELRREIATERYVGSRDAPFEQAEEDRATRSPIASDLTAETAVVGSYTNGYSGQSIEAGFTFETAFRFETEFEAEATEDWLKLSSDGLAAHGRNFEMKSQEARSQGEPLNDSLLDGTDFDTMRQQRIASSATGAPLITEAEQQPAGTSINEWAPASELVRDSAPALNPQAVRSAIFRLAQESHVGRGATTYPESSMKAESAIEDAAFAEVALQMWGDPDEGRKEGEEIFFLTEAQDGSNVASQQALYPEQAFEEAGVPAILRSANLGTELGDGDSFNTDEREELGGERAGSSEEAQPVLGSISLSDIATTGSVNPDPGALDLVSSSDAKPDFDTIASLTHEVAAPDFVELHLTESVPTAHALALLQDTAAAVPDFDLESVLGVEGASEIDMPAASVVIAGSAVAEVSMGEPAPISAVTLSDPERSGLAEGAPALAHDAGNLLSALNLYSELLALTGVLDARHKHYAQDLKLLAARSEVLISRLLANCAQAERTQRGSTPENTEAILVLPDPQVIEEAAADVELNALSAAELAADAVGQLPGAELDAWNEPTDFTQATVGFGEEQASLIHGPADLLHEAAYSTHEAADATQELADSIQILPDTPQMLADTPQDLADATHEPAAFTDPALSDVDQSEEALTAASPQSNATTIDPSEVTPLNLVDLLTRWRSLLSMIGRGSVEVNFGPNAELPIQVKEETMERILVNLVHNAMTATRGGGAIRIGVGRIDKRDSLSSTPSLDGRAQPANRMVLTVDDSGCGMTEAQIEQVFGRASDAGAATDAMDLPRSGTGLQIVRELLAASGGQFALYSRSGAGTRIEMAWPAVESGALAARIPPASVGLDGGAPRTDLQYNHVSGRTRVPDLRPFGTSRPADASLANDMKGAIAC